MSQKEIFEALFSKCRIEYEGDISIELNDIYIWMK